MTVRLGAALARVVRGETALHRRLRRETLLALAIVSFVVIYRWLAAGVG